MFVSICELEIFLPESDSLKSKRMILNHLRDSVKNKFNVSFAEVEEQDKWQRAVLGIATVSSAAQHAQDSLENVIKFIEKDDRIEIIKIKKDLV